MTFRQLNVGDVFRFPEYDDPWKGLPNAKALWKKVNHAFYVNLRDFRFRQGIDDPHRNVYKEEMAVH
jgi:hypothetical protein